MSKSVKIRRKSDALPGRAWICIRSCGAADSKVKFPRSGTNNGKSPVFSSIVHDVEVGFAIEAGIRNSAEWQSSEIVSSSTDADSGPPQRTDSRSVVLAPVRGERGSTQPMVSSAKDSPKTRTHPPALTLALSDLNVALRIDSNDLKALTLRAEVFAKSGDAKRAARDDRLIKKINRHINWKYAQL